MKLHVIGTGSKGNSYILEGKNTALLIECGMPLREVKKALNFDLSKVVGCVLSHLHNDHAGRINEFLSNSITVYSSKGTFEGLGLIDHHNTKIVKQGVKYKIGDFTVVPFNVFHDAPEPLGFLIHHDECGLTLFLTDTFYSKYKFKGLNNIIVEANFCEEIIEEKLKFDKQFLHNRILKSHLSIQKCIDLLNSNDITAVNNIVLIHLSDSNSNALQFKQKTELATGIQTTIAENGLTIEFNKNDF